VVAERGNQNAVSDVGVAALLAQAAVRAALLNVDINLRALEDRIYVRQVRAEVERLKDGLQSETERVIELVNSKIHI
jgi:formiminotetrahydrofolate cyclodeaminase